MMKKARLVLRSTIALTVLAVTGALASTVPAAAAPSYKLPWAAPAAWNVTQGHHATRAFDFQPPGGGSHKNEVLAVESGTARLTCTDRVGQAIVSLATGGGTFRYIHLQTSAVTAAGISSGGVPVRQGQVLGRLHPSPPGSNTGCGYALPAGASHLHLEMPSLPIVMDGVTFSTAGVSNRRPTSSNVRGGSQPGSPTTQLRGFDGDGRSDLLYQDPGSTAWRLLTSNGSGVKTASVFAAGMSKPAWQVSGDFSGDGRSDVLYQDTGSTSIRLITSAGTTAGSNVVFAAGMTMPDWRLSGDFDGDGRSDLLYQDPGSTAWRLLTSNGSGVKTASVFAAGMSKPAWQVSGDFSGDGRSDVLYQDTGSTSIRLITSAGTTAGSNVVFAAGMTMPDWRLSGDFDGDGRSDLLYQDPGSTAWRLLTSNGSGVKTASVFAAGMSKPAWQVSGDFSGDGRSDVLYQDTGSTSIRLITSAGTTAGPAGVFAAGMTMSDWRLPG